VPPMDALQRGLPENELRPFARSAHRLLQYSPFYVRVPPDAMFLQLSTPKVVGE
jgi:hypothetical protein